MFRYRRANDDWRVRAGVSVFRGLAVHLGAALLKRRILVLHNGCRMEVHSPALAGHGHRFDGAGVDTGHGREMVSRARQGIISGKHSGSSREAAAQK
jgi:hypothetical protein